MSQQQRPRRPPRRALGVALLQLLLGLEAARGFVVPKNPMPAAAVVRYVRERIWLMWEWPRKLQCLSVCHRAWSPACVWLNLTLPDTNDP